MARAKRARRYGPGESLPGKVPLPRAEDEGGTCGGRVGGWSGEEGGGRVVVARFDYSGIEVLPEEAHGLAERLRLRELLLLAADHLADGDRAGRAEGLLNSPLSMAATCGTMRRPSRGGRRRPSRCCRASTCPAPTTRRRRRSAGARRRVRARDRRATARPTSSGARARRRRSPRRRPGRSRRMAA